MQLEGNSNLVKLSLLATLVEGDSKLLSIALYIYIYIYIYIYVYIVQLEGNSNLVKLSLLATLVKGDPKLLFSIATTPRCTGKRYSFARTAPLYP